MNTSLYSLFKLPGLTRGHILKRTLAKAAALGCIAVLGKSAFAQTWTATTAPVATWASVASSADGNRLAALVAIGSAVYLSPQGRPHLEYQQSAHRVDGGIFDCFIRGGERVGLGRRQSPELLT